jgi:hypothetical protein
MPSFHFFSSRLLTTALFIASISMSAIAQNRDFEGAPLDAPYPRPAKSAKKPGADTLLETRFEETKSDTLALISKQTPVRSQDSRGTCSIFSATGLLEALINIKAGQALQDNDLSEEWLEYIVTRGQSSDGSTSTANLRAFEGYGSPDEVKLPYIGVEWTSLDSDPRAQARCGHLNSWDMKSCLIGHRSPHLLNATDEELLTPQGPLYDPEFQLARQAARQMREELLLNATSDNYIDVSTVKELLSKGIPVLVDLDFFYGAWNHRKAATLGIGRNLEHWSQGVVSYPERDSYDYVQSTKYENRAGHSVVLVGYDNSKEVTYSYLAADGTTRKTMKRQGVFYFKNSWGASSFGVQFQLGGETHSGYGMILQDYADHYGTYHAMSLDGKLQ